MVLREHKDEHVSICAGPLVCYAHSSHGRHPLVITSFSLAPRDLGPNLSVPQAHVDPHPPRRSPPALFFFFFFPTRPLSRPLKLHWVPSAEGALSPSWEHLLQCLRHPGGTHVALSYHDSCACVSSSAWRLAEWEEAGARAPLGSAAFPAESRAAPGPPACSVRMW